MAPTESTQSEGANALDRSSRPQTPTERLAHALERDGYDVAYQGREVTSPSDPRRAIEFVEVEVSPDQRDQLANAVEQLEPSVTHRLIGPDDTRALRSWPQASDGEDETGSKRTVLIAPLSRSRYTSEEQDRLRASHL